ncbi:fibronectin type III-like domain-contianing protein [Lactococcus allomyrinae]|uniref:fibronectin type III-like domain-contianing protein n=1 Tax=Lactococcus allomyrinae TaxID=2419773 RepID=UPI003B84692D
MSEIRLSDRVMTNLQPVSISLLLTNESEYDTAESVLLFMEDPVSKIVRPVRELLDFKRVALDKGESKRVEFSVSTDSLSAVNNQGEKQLEAGVIRFYINDLTEKIGEVEVVK